MLNREAPRAPRLERETKKKKTEKRTKTTPNRVESIGPNRTESGRIESNRIDSSRIESDRVESSRIESSRTESDRVESSRIGSNRSILDLYEKDTEKTQKTIKTGWDEEKDDTRTEKIRKRREMTHPEKRRRRMKDLPRRRRWVYKDGEGLRVAICRREDMLSCFTDPPLPTARVFPPLPTARVFPHGGA